MYPAVTATRPARDDIAGDDTAGTDAALARRAVDDPAAFGELYQRYRTRVYWYLRARTSNDEDAADVTQQVFAATLARLHQFRPRKASFATWLFTIARNAAIDFHRRRPSTTDWDSLPAALHPSDDRDLAAPMLRREAISRLGDLMAQLPRDKRELLVLRYGAELSIAEISAVVGKSHHATRKQLTRILQTLEDKYDPTDRS